MADLINVGGTLYGDTPQGGPKNAGTVFSITTSGKKTIVYSFQGGADGYYPQAPLIDVDGTLYGTTGSYHGCATLGCGTVYAISESGEESVVYSFGGKPDGAGPRGGLIDVNGTLYGTTSYGGADGFGSVFSLTLANRSRRANVITSPR